MAGYPINVYAGGASLISPRFLLTAAHIFNTDGQYAVRTVLCRYFFVFILIVVSDVETGTQ